MNFSTNQVIQFYCLESGASLATQTYPDGSVQFQITHADSKVETTDVIKALVGKKPVAADIITPDSDKDKKALKEFTVKVGDDLVVVGQEYVIGLTFRGFGLEDTYHKIISARATSTTDTELYKALAISAWYQRMVNEYPFFDIYVNAEKVESLAKLKDDSTDFSDGFVIKEAEPYWKLGAFPETTMTIEVGASPIWVNGVEHNDWLVNTKFEDELTPSIVNSHKIADLEYFAKGERGNSNALKGWPDNIEPDLYVNPKSATGYSVLNVHYAFVGANDEVQKSERDAIFVVEGTTTTNLTSIVTALANVPVIA